MNRIEIINILTDKVIKTIGLELDKQFSIIDQDTGNIIRLNGKFIKYYFGQQPEIIDYNDKILDVTKDSYLMNFFVSYYVEKLKMEIPELYIHSFHPIIDKKTGKSALEIKGFIDGEPLQLMTRFYKNNTLKFIEALFLLSEDEIDLTIYDNELTRLDEEEMKMLELLAKKNKLSNPRRKKVVPGIIYE